MEKNKSISKLYDDYRETEFESSRKFKEKSKQFIEKIEQFCKKIKDKDKKELDEIINLVFEMNAELEKQSFIYAYSLGVRLTTEALYETKEK